MERRAFIRVVGGGVVLAATAGVAGCSQDMPAEAIAAWQGPGAETDLRRWVLSYAILAPHAHNLQSWLVDLSKPEEITLYCDRQRLLPDTDPYSRQIMVSHGTFLELLDLAARERGLRAEIELFPEGAFDDKTIDDRPVARIRLVPDAAVTKDPLFAQILKRHTNRNVYDPKQSIQAQAWEALAAAAQPYPVKFGYVSADRPEALAQHRAIASEAWKIELITPRTILESYHVLRVGAREIAEHRDGIAVTSPMLVALTRLGLFDRSKAPAPTDSAITSQISEFDAKLASSNAFLWLISDDNTRTTQIATGRAYVRVQLAATAHGVVMHPLSQALQEYPEQAGPYAQIHALLGAERPNQTVQMWLRVGVAAPVGPAPRRGLEAQIRKVG